MRNILVLDLGTTYFKASAFQHPGPPVGTVRLPVPVRTPETGRCELAVEDFRRAVIELLRRLEQEASGSVSQASALTFATQTNSFLLASRSGNPLTPFLLWPDQRARHVSDDLAALVTTEPFQATTGVPGLTHEFMVAKIGWFRQHQPETFRRVGRVELISDYLTRWLTGQHVTEAGAAGLTGLLNIHTLNWWSESCDRAGVPAAWLPRVVRAGTDLGPVLSKPAAQLGLPPSCRFVVGCLDQYAGAIGAANAQPGNVSETTGTVLATVRCADQTHDTRRGPSRVIFQGPGFRPGIVYQMVFGNTSANLLEAYRNSLPDRPEFSELDQAAARVGPGAGGLRLRNETEAIILRGQGRQWQQRFGRGRAVRAILEAVAYALADQVEQLCGTAIPATIGCAGGAARSSLWLQIKADVLNRTLVPVDCREPTSLGASLLAQQAMEGTAMDELAATIPRREPPIEPNADRHRRYDKLRSEGS